MIDNFNKQLSVRDVAKKFGFTEDWVRDLIQAKRIKATKIGYWRIKEKDLQVYIKSRQNY